MYQEEEIFKLILKTHPIKVLPSTLTKKWGKRLVFHNHSGDHMNICCLCFPPPILFPPFGRFIAIHWEVLVGNSFRKSWIFSWSALVAVFLWTCMFINPMAEIFWGNGEDVGVNSRLVISIYHVFLTHFKRTWYSLFI